MPRIKPFCALKPAAALLAKVVTRPLENYSMGQARLIASENPISFLHLINPELDNPYLRGSRQELVFKKINENLDDFIEQQVLITEEKPSIYIYQVEHDGLLQTGIWTLTHINDYLDGHIKKHEHTVERREKLLAEYLQQTDLDANPVLITYHPNAEVKKIVEKYLAQKPTTDFSFADATKHRLWTVNEKADLDILVGAFAQIPAVYIADGHHRAASMAKMGLYKRNRHAHDEEADFNYFSTVYMDTQEVKVLEYNRLVRDLEGLTTEEFLSALTTSFEIEKMPAPFKPSVLHEFGMYLKSGWYKLTAKPHLHRSDPVGCLDVSILQEHILVPLLHISDPRTDARLTFEGGKTPLSELEKQVNNGTNAVAFVLVPTAIEQLINVADANQVMPPKSTWVEPKFLVGLLSHHFKG